MKNTLEMKTSSGFEVKIKKKKFHNMRLIDKLAEVQNNGLGVGEVFVLLLGEKGKEEFYNYHEDEDGIVNPDNVMKDFEEIFTAYEETKN